MNGGYAFELMRDHEFHRTRWNHPVYNCPADSDWMARTSPIEGKPGAAVRTKQVTPRRAKKLREWSPPQPRSPWRGSFEQAMAWIDGKDGV